MLGTMLDWRMAIVRNHRKLLRMVQPPVLCTVFIVLQFHPVNSHV
jgi:hypothetical protein